MTGGEVTKSAAGESAGAEHPVLRIERGDPTPEELAAVLAVLAVAGAGRQSAPAAPAPASGWTDRSRYVRRPLVPAPNGWRAAGFPR